MGSGNSIRSPSKICPEYNISPYLYFYTNPSLNFFPLDDSCKLLMDLFLLSPLLCKSTLNTEPEGSVITSDHVMPLFEILQWVPVELRVLTKVLMKIYWVLCKLSPAYPVNFLAHLLLPSLSLTLHPPHCPPHCSFTNFLKAFVLAVPPVCIYTCLSLSSPSSVCTNVSIFCEVYTPSVKITPAPLRIPTTINQSTKAPVPHF